MKKEMYKVTFHATETLQNGKECTTLQSVYMPRKDEETGQLITREQQITQLPEGLTVGGDLYLRGTQITQLPEGLTVGGDLDLENCEKITQLPEGLTVGGSLYLRGTQITQLPEGLTVGGYLDLRGTQITNPEHYKKLREGDYVPNKLLLADGIVTLVKRRKKLGKYVYYIGRIKGHNVLSDGSVFAHCKTLAEGVADIEFKQAEDRGSDQYKRLTLDSVLKTPDAIVMYRIITGACKAGTERFLATLGQLKDEYTVRDIIEITRGQYGAATLQKFFEV